MALSGWGVGEGQPPSLELQEANWRGRSGQDLGLCYPLPRRDLSL